MLPLANIRVVELSHIVAGPTAGLLAAKGEVCCLFDADDVWHPRKLSRVAEALKDPEVKSRLAANGAETVTSDRATPEALRRHLAAEIAKWVPIIQKAGVKAE